MLFPLYVLNPRLRFPIATLLIIFANILVMGWLSQERAIEQSKIAAEYGFVPARLTLLGSGKAVDVPVQTFRIFGMRGPQLVMRVSTDARNVYRTFFSMMFLHGGWMHLLMNMWMLWLFGPNIEDRLGHVVFSLFYALGGVVAMLAFWASDPSGVMPVIGASGAVAAVLGAYAVTFPAAKVRTLIFFIFILIFDLPALAVLGVWFMLQVVSGMMGLWGLPVEPIAFWAHVGGFVAGMILMPLLSFGASPPGADWRKESDDMFRFDDPRFTNQSDGRS
jgi:membrane associated rhomboid family serine protease